MKAPPAEVPGAAEVLAQARAENFPVASWLFPRQLRPHLMNVYGFARLTDASTMIGRHSSDRDRAGACQRDRVQCYSETQ